MKKISIIVAIYNVKEYVEKCVSSILKQTYTNLEIILVDDGAADGSGDICDSMAQKDSRIVVIHKENGGLSDARNAGLDIATGDYISFVDGDDTIEPDMFEKLVSDIEKYDADVSCCRYRKVWENGESLEIGADHETHIYEGLESLKEYLYGKILDPFAVCKLYRRSILYPESSEPLRFIKGITSEDNPFCVELFKTTGKVVVSGEASYNYLQKRAGSITNVAVSKNKIDAVCRWNDIRLDCKKVDPSLEIYALRRQMLFYIGLYNDICGNKEYKELAHDLQSTVKEHCSEIQKSDICEKTVKISVLLLSKCPAVYRIVMKLYKKFVGEAQL